MITSIFSVYDSKTAAYLPPFFMVTKPAAMRAIADAVADPDHTFYRHAEDYSLFFLGTFCDNTGKIDMETAPVNLCGLHELSPEV